MTKRTFEFIKISDFIGNGIIVADKDGVIFSINNWIKRFIGEDVRGSIVTDKLKKLDKLDVLSKIKSSIESGKMWFFSYTIHKEALTLEKNGEKHFVDLYILPWNKRLAVLVFNNITIYIQKIEKINELKTELKKKNIAVIKANKELTLLKNIASVMVFQQADDKIVAEQLLSLLTGFFSAQRGGIYIYNLEKNLFHLIAQKNVSANVKNKYSKVLFNNEKFATHIALKKRKSIVIEDVKSFSKRFPVLSELKSKSLIIIPVVSTRGEGIYGIVYLGFDRKVKIDRRDKSFLGIIQKYLSLGYERRFLVKTLKDRNMELNRILEEKIKEINDQYQLISKAEKLSLIGRVSASIIHDIGTPLTYIRSNAEMIKAFSKKLFESESEKERKRLIEEIKEMSEEIFDGTSRIRSIISNFKAFLSKEVKKERFKLKDAVDNALKLTYSKWEGRIEIELNFEDNLPEVYGNRSQIEQVIVNLLTNAFYSVIKKGRKRVWIKVEKYDDDFVLLRVIDEGVGIKKEDLPRLFEPLFTTKPLKDEGMGLGLSIVKEIVESHGGKIEVNSKEGEGAEFKVFIPVYRGEKRR